MRHVYSNGEKNNQKKYRSMYDLRFTSFSTVFQSYQDDERLVMKGCVQWNRVYG